MLTLGVENFLQKKYKLLGIDGRWKDTLGELPHGFELIVYGPPGSGKTSLLLQLAKEFAKRFGDVEYWSFEQAHTYSLKLSIEREGFHEVSGKIQFVDPLKNADKDTPIIEVLKQRMRRRNGAKFFFIDSVTSSGFTKDDVDALKKEFGHKLGIVWTCHSKGKLPDTAVGVHILKFGDIGLYVHKMIAEVTKGRFMGTEPFVIWEERARVLNPLFFAAPKKEKTKRHKKTLKRR